MTSRGVRRWKCEAVWDCLVSEVGTDGSWKWEWKCEDGHFSGLEAR